MKRIIINVCISTDAVSSPPKKGTIGLGVSLSVRKGQKIGLYAWFVTSNSTWERQPIAQEKMRLMENWHFSLTLILSTGKIALVNLG